MIKQNILKIKETLPSNVQLVAVSKYNPIASVQQAYEVGQRFFGESQAQELMQKVEALPKDIKWHFIGHLQTNKVKYIVPHVACIESVDSFKLLKEINKQVAKIDRVVNCLLQFHVAQEDTKYGFDLQECKLMLDSEEFKSLTHINIIGIMAMATFTDNKAQVRQEFATAKQIFDYLKSTYFTANAGFCELSMGMSDDYPIAIEEGATLVRVGSRIFGERVY